MLLYMISRVRSLNISFYIGFVFLFSKTYNNYLWILLFFQQFYQKMNILDLVFIGINYEKALICTL